MKERYCPNCNSCQTIQLPTNKCEFCGHSLDDTSRPLFVAGGIYYKDTDKEEFYMVCPGGEDKTPYVTPDGDKLYRLTRHHSHLYQVITPTKLKLVRESWEASGVGSPSVVELKEYHAELLKKGLTNKIFADMSDKPAKSLK